MKISNIGYLLKEGIRGIFLRGFMSFAAVCVTVACLLIIGSFSCLMYNVNEIVVELNQTNEIRVFIDENLPDAEAKSVGTKIAVLENIHSLEFVSREQALEEFVEDHDGDEAFTGIEAQDLRHRFKVFLEDPSLLGETVEQIRNIPGVADTAAEYELAAGFIAVQKVLRIVSFAIIAVLLVVSLLIISNTVKLAMYDRRDEIAIMKMVGATNGFIRLPFLVEGLLLGMLGAAIAFGLEWLLYDAMVKQINEAKGVFDMLNLVPFQTLLVPMIIVFAAAGLFVGIVGSWTSIRKFMDV